MNKKGIIAIISGFSGVGKGTIVKSLLTVMDMLYQFLRRRESQEKEK